MSWGSIVPGDGSECHRCPHLDDCRAACRNRAKVCCEDVTIGRRRGGRLIEFLTPGQVFTSNELSAVSCVERREVSSWCAKMRSAGIIELIGKRRSRHYSSEYVYRYVVSPGDGMTVTTITKNQGSAGAVVPPLDETTEREVT